MQGGTVNLLEIVGVVLIAAGIIGPVYGGITYTKATHEAKIGSFEMSVKDRETANIPPWIVVGGALLFVRGKA